MTHYFVTASTVLSWKAGKKADKRAGRGRQFVLRQVERLVLGCEEVSCVRRTVFARQELSGDRLENCQIGIACDIDATSQQVSVPS